MKRQVNDWTIEKIFNTRSDISFPEFQREPRLWSDKNKMLLIDSIFADIDIPKLYFYWNSVEKTWDVIDGQQRLWAIWGFIESEYEIELDGRLYNFDDLDITMQKKILQYKLQVVELKGSYDKFIEQYLKKLFIRLQLGLLLVPGEKLNAATGKMRDYVFNEMSKHPFIAGVGFPKRRYARETLCAQICINSYYLSIEDKTFARTRYDDLELFFNDLKKPADEDKELFKELKSRVNKVLSKLHRDFGDKAQLLKNRSMVLSIYLFYEEHIINRKQQELSKFVDFILLLQTRLKEDAAKGIERENIELYELSLSISNAPGERYQIERRHEKLKKLYKHFQKFKKIKGD